MPEHQVCWRCFFRNRLEPLTSSWLKPCARLCHCPKDHKYGISWVELKLFFSLDYLKKLWYN